MAFKYANSFKISRLKAYFYPQKLGVGTPGGCEAVIHAARRILESVPANSVLVKLDFSNAFNSIHRRDMLSSVHEKNSRTASLLLLCLQTGIMLVLWTIHHPIRTEPSTRGSDRIGPLLSSNTLHPTLSSPKASLNIGYLDDVTLGDTQSVVAADVKELIEEGAKIRLSLNVDKRELITHKDTQGDDDILRSYNRVELEEATLLGAPLLLARILIRCVTIGAQPLPERVID